MRKTRPDRCGVCDEPGHNRLTCTAVPGREGKKRCASCKEWLPVTDFSVRSKEKGTLQRLCKPCLRPYRRRWYQKHRAEQVERTKRSRPSRIDTARAYIWELKSSPCKDCGLTFHPSAMDFDHVRGKTMNVGRMVTQGHSIESLKEEIEKCEIVCANCHRLRTWQRAKKKWNRPKPGRWPQAAADPDAARDRSSTEP